MKREKSI